MAYRPTDYVDVHAHYGLTDPRRPAGALYEPIPSFGISDYGGCGDVGHANWRWLDSEGIAVPAVRNAHNGYSAHHWGIDLDNANADGDVLLASLPPMIETGGGYGSRSLYVRADLADDLSAVDGDSFAPEALEYSEAAEAADAVDHIVSTLEAVLGAADYPIIDESKHSEVRSEWEHTAWADYVSDLIRTGQIDGTERVSDAAQDMIDECLTDDQETAVVDAVNDILSDHWGCPNGVLFESGYTEGDMYVSVGPDAVAAIRNAVDSALAL